MNSIRHNWHSLRNVFKQAGFSPRADWAVALSVFVILLIVTAAMSSFVYVTLSREGTAEAVSGDATIQMIDRDKLVSVTRHFRERAVDARPDASVFVDPSR